MQADRVLVAPNWWIGIIPRALWRRKKVFYGYAVDFVPLALLSTAEQVQPIQKDDFLMLGIGAFITDTSSPPLIIWGGQMTNNAPANVLIQIRDTASGYDLFQTRLPLDNVAGSGPCPAPMGIPYLFQAGSSLQTTVQSLQTQATRLRLLYWGVQVLKGA